MVPVEPVPDRNELGERGRARHVSVDGDEEQDGTYHRHLRRQLDREFLSAFGFRPTALRRTNLTNPATPFFNSKLRRSLYRCL